MKKSALEESLRALHTDSFAWAVRCCHNNVDAGSEVLQMAYLKVLEGKAVFKNKSSVKTWFFSVIRFTAIDFYRKKKRSFELLDVRTDRVEFDVATLDSSDSHQQLFEHCLAQLSAKQAQLLHLIFYQNCSITEAASIMELKIGTARTHYKRGKERLKKLLLNAGITPETYHHQS